MGKTLLATLFITFSAFSQGYTSYFTGNQTNITTTPEFGVCMMGGATEHDNAMIWLLQKANGGDVVVLRSSGSNGYNDYLYSDLGVNVNSVETLVITSVAGATNPYVLDKVANAEMIWFAGGDQWNYVSYFKNNALEDLLNQHINVKHAPIGGTSAGMAILGGNYFSAQNGSVTTAEALANPYNDYMTFGNGDFLEVPMLQNVITDTHYDDPDRRGRHSAFIARLRKDLVQDVRGIACNEYVAVCFDQTGQAHVFGDYPNYQEFAFFVGAPCSNMVQADVCQAGAPLTWNTNNSGQALKVYKVPGTMAGTNSFDINPNSWWQSGSGSGGSWENWWITAGVFNTQASSDPDCSLSVNQNDISKVQLVPNPFDASVEISNVSESQFSIIDASGKIIKIGQTSGTIDTSFLKPGIYFMTITSEGKSVTRKMVKR
ncbi:T9SS type A sorting domain-containing protein [Flavobacterium sp.]|uniref:T9SS type A sorting domain-containing protein n=1 Tax=Flavobacterium sp. TaxID=239 RepID=UPI0012063997|nr:T9SS type A sorting domain-containing protein [Flavobacterium sp.]RZJ70228.1 MAG: T9SS type A sorting domain-containing protein [Flavobacterium sp.]